ncbi:MAG: hypothetical protein OEV95_01350 [Gemmatimonadota bacterium]|nr:hypothetical protein [Gemmatimonadota bacterium]
MNLASRGLLAALVLMPSFAASQADSLSSLARSSYREAVAAGRGGDVALAREKFVDAATLWPAQAAYLHAAASASARLGDTAAVVRWLGRVADLGQWREVRGDDDFASVLGAADIEAAIARLEANRLPLARSRIAFTLPDSTFFAEGIDVDPLRREWFVGSIRHGRILRIDQSGRARPFASGTVLDAVFGVRVDPTRRRLWVTTRATPLQGGFQPDTRGGSSIVVFSLDDESVLARLVLPDNGATHTLGDLAIAPDGSAYITDSEQPVLFRAQYEAAHGIAAEPWLEHRLFRSLQGVALADDGKTASLADYSHGILALDLATRAVREIPAPAGVSTLGIDGLIFWRGSLVGIQNGSSPPRVVRLTLSPKADAVDRLDVIDRNLPVADEPTTATRLEDRLYYIGNSHWPLYQDDGRPKAGAVFAPTAVMELILTP